jgi:hypothetical protein
MNELRVIPAKAGTDASASRSLPDGLVLCRPAGPGFRRGDGKSQ